MNRWGKDELRRIAGTDDLPVAPFRDDGTTYGTPTWIWSAVVDDDLHVRACNGTSSRWYQAALTQKSGRITAAGITKEVGFAPVVRAGDPPPLTARLNRASSAWQPPSSLRLVTRTLPCPTRWIRRTPRRPSRRSTSGRCRPAASSRCSSRCSRRRSATRCA